MHDENGVRRLDAGEVPEVGVLLDGFVAGTDQVAAGNDHHPFPKLVEQCASPTSVNLRRKCDVTLGA
jgi:hypothetical protein